MADSIWSTLQGVTFSQHYIQAGSWRTRVFEAGPDERPLLLFLHGVNGHAEAYVRNIAAHAEHFHVVAADFVGHGFSDKPLDLDYEIGAYVRQVEGILAHFGASSVYLSGESLGGWVSARFAIEHPETVTRLVLNTPGGLRADPKVMENLKTLTLEAVTNPTRDKVRKRVEWLFKRAEDIPDDLVECRYRIYAQPGYQEVTKRTLCLQEMDVRVRNLLREEDLARISCPTLLVWTTADPMQGVDVGEWAQEHIADSQLFVMENSAHWPQFEEPDVFNAAELKFLLAS